MRASAVLGGLVQGLGVCLFKWIAHSLIDLPDIALYRACRARAAVANDVSSQAD